MGLKWKRGNLIMGSVFAVAILGATLVYFAQSVFSSRRTAVGLIKAAVAESLASELTEFFRSLKSSELNAHMAGRFRLCENIDKINRTGSSPGTVVSSPDPLAQLVASTLEGVQPADRYYRVEVIDISTAQPNSVVCGRLAPYALAANERFLVSTIVDWPEGTTNPVFREVRLATLLVE